MHLATLIAHCWTAASLVGAIILPRNPPNGFYLSTVDANGDFTTTHYGDNFTLAAELGLNPNSDPPDPSNSARSLKRNDANVHCEGYPISPNDKDVAINGLADWFGYGQEFKGKTDAHYVWGSVVVYACDYSKPVSYTKGQFLNDMRAIDDSCGDTGAGWYTWQNIKSTFGRAGTAHGYC